MAITSEIEAIFSQTRKLEKSLVEKKIFAINGNLTSVASILKSEKTAMGFDPRVIQTFDGIMLEFLNGFQMLDLFFLFLIEPAAKTTSQQLIYKRAIGEKFLSIFSHYQISETTRNFQMEELKFHQTSKHPGFDYFMRIKTGDNDYVWRSDVKTKGNYFEMAGGRRTSRLYFNDRKLFPEGCISEPIVARITGSAIGYKHLIYLDRMVAIDEKGELILTNNNGVFHRFEFLTNSFFETIHMDNNLFGSNNWNGILDITTEDDLRYLVDYDNPFIGIGMDHVFLLDSEGKPRLTCSIFAAGVIDPSIMNSTNREMVIRGNEFEHNGRPIRKFFKTDTDKDKGAAKRIHGSHYCDGTLRFPHLTTAKEFRFISFTDEIMGSKLRKYSDPKIGLMGQSILSAITLFMAVPMWELNHKAGDCGFVHHGTTYENNPFLRHFFDITQKLPGEKLPVFIEIDKPRIAIIIHNCFSQKFVDRVKIVLFGSTNRYSEKDVSKLFLECLATLYNKWEHYAWILPFEETRYGKTEFKNFLGRFGFLFKGHQLIGYNKKEYGWYIDALMHSKVPHESFWRYNKGKRKWVTIYGTPASSYLNDQLNLISVWVGGNPIYDGPGYLRVLRQKLRLLYRKGNYNHVANLLGFAGKDGINRLNLFMNQGDQDMDFWLRHYVAQMPEVNIQQQYAIFGYNLISQKLKKKMGRK